MRNDGRVALVTGSSSGIGAGIARALAADGFTVAVNSVRSIGAGKALADELGGSYAQGDISVAAQADAIVATTVGRHGRLDVLVNCAATTRVIPHADIDALTDEVWHEILDTNVIGTWHMIRAAVPHLRATGAGHVVTVTSRAGSRPTGSSIPYAVSKAGLNHLTLLLAKALGPTIRVNAVAPGLIDTPWTAGPGFAELREQVVETAPLGRTGTPDDVGAVVVGLVNMPYTTGAVVGADGGMGLVL